MADIALKDNTGNPQGFGGVDKVLLPAQDSTEDTPVWIPYTHGEVEDKTIAPDFSTGDMTVNADSGKLWRAVTIEKPAELTPENVAEGVSIAGVTGTHVGGTGAVTEALSVTANGTYTPGEGVDGFSPVTVKVPNTYADADEGKVVVSKALKAQTSVTVTETGTYTTTTNNEVIVSIPDAKGVKF